jgi:peptidoglycan-N-acetylglucosamine deacetylase
MKLFRFLGACALAICLLTVGASATTKAPAPFGVTAATFSQDGQQLVWHVQLGHRFAPAALAKDGRSLCLLVERASNGHVTGTLCVEPARNGRSSVLAYQKSGQAHSTTIDATIARTGGDDLIARFAPNQIGNSFTNVRWQVLNGLRPPACTPPQPNPFGCTTLFPSKPALTKLHTPKLAGCVPSGPPFVSHGPRDRHVVALTFDDGPWPDTPQFLDILEHNHINATFFQIGEQVSTYGRAVDNRMLADGDIIGDHTWSHIDVAGAGPTAASQISRTADAIRALTGFTPCLFRAPGGAVSPALITEARQMGFTTIQWDVDPRDWSRPGTGAIYSTVVDNAHNGSIILQHDGGGNRSETLAALPQEIATLRKRGYKFVTIPQLLGLRLIYK